MADLPLVNRYKSYKEGTESLVRWITQTASLCSNAATFLHTLAIPESSAITLTTRELVTLTNLIVANIAVEIPEKILKITQDVVAEREICANWYKNQNMDGELTESDKTHAYFIGTLHEIHHILDSAYDARAARKQEFTKQTRRQTPYESMPGASENSFRHLKVEEPVENPLGTTTATVEGFTMVDKLTFRLEKQKGDKAFAIWCLLEDFGAVRKYVASIWRDYKAGRKSLLATGAITDSAYGIMRHANEDFANGNGDVSNYPAMLAFLEEEMLVPAKNEKMQRAPMEDESVEGEIMKDERTGKTTSRRRFPAVQYQDLLLCREAGQLFESLTKTFRGGAICIEPDAPLPSACTLIDELPLGSFGDTLLKLAPTVQQVARQVPAIFATEEEQDNRLSCDEFLSALMKHSISDKSSQVSIWLVAAGQSYMELHAILNGEMSCGTEEFRSYLDIIRPVAKIAQQIGPKTSAANPDNGRDRFFERLVAEEFSNHFDASEELAQVAKSQDWNFTFPKSTAVLAHFLPLYPCCYNYRTRYDMQYFSMQFLGAGMIVLSMAHLYKAGQRYGLIKSAWKDMDFILAKHVTYKIGRPGLQPVVSKPSERAGPFEMAALFRTALGVPTVDLDKAVRPRLPDIEDLTWRCIIPQSDLINAMQETQREVIHLKSSDREYINIVLRRLSDAERKGKNKGRTTTKYTLVELLETYEKHFTADEPILTFDYIGFADICAINLRILSHLYHPGSKRAPMPEVEDFVDCLLWTAADVVKKAKNKSPEELRQALLKTKFAGAIAHLESINEVAGSEFSNPTLERSSRHVPTHMRPPRN